MSLTLRERVMLAKQASLALGQMKTSKKNEVLLAMAEALEGNIPLIMQANDEDVEVARSNGVREAMIDRLRLTEARIKGMAQGAREVAALPDPVGAEDGWVTPNGLHISRQRVPMGVLAIVYEARPNVTVDAAALAFKSGNACVLRGSRQAERSNACLAAILRSVLEAQACSPDCIVMIPPGDHAEVAELGRMLGLIDCLIPRGGAGLIKSVVENSSVPVIQTGVGNCHLYVHEDADLDMALNILVNGKTQRPSVCNALETLLVDKSVAERFLPMVSAKLGEELHVEFHACPRSLPLLQGGRPAAELDWDTEYLDLILAVKVVDSLDEALEHIRLHSTGHSECIITNNLAASQRFTAEIDAAAVYVNASTRFTDGGEFGFGAEMGISTQKLHARGPVGLRELTTCKFVIMGQGQVR